MAAAEGSRYRAYRSRPADGAEVVSWVQIDLGSSQSIDAVKLYPSKTHLAAGDGFPLRFRIECSDESRFLSKQVIADWTKTDYPDPEDHIVQFNTQEAKGRYVRLTATRLRAGRMPPILLTLPKSIVEPVEQLAQTIYVLSLAKIEILSEGTDIAHKRPVTVDAAYGNPEDAAQITRPPRPQGEGIITDNARNVTSPSDWRPVPYRARAPLTGVQLQDGLFLGALKNNVRYLNDTFEVADLLRQFRQRAGLPVPASSRPAHALAGFWEEALAGSNAGRFLMGAGNTLRWLEDAELRQRMDAVVGGIAECRQPNGYIMAYPEDTFFFSERGAYTRSWLTQGLIEAGLAGNASAFELLRAYYDWFNRCPYLPEALRACIQGGQGMVANSRLYFTPIGRPEDIQVLQRYFQENYWLEDLAVRKVDAVWQYPYDRPHAYLLTNLEAYLDIYRATGDQRYLNAVLGGWELYRENWQNVGGSISIIELKKNVPRSNPLYEALGETCGSAFWVSLNQRLHLLAPEEEKYVTEIEKSIYNVLLANQGGAAGFRYHTLLVGQKEAPTCTNKCCEGQGTRLIGSLPEYIYSLADNGLYVNLFEPSIVTWQQSSAAMRLVLDTEFPRKPAVRMTVHTARPMASKIRIRIPSWAAGAVDIAVNGIHSVTGIPGSYATLDRQWSEGDTISFVLPMAFRLTEYTGVDQVAGRVRYSLEYGPLLMAALGAGDKELILRLASSPRELVGRLQPVKDRPLHFKISVDPAGTEFVPYFEVGSESFSCVPLIEAKASVF